MGRLICFYLRWYELKQEGELDLTSNEVEILEWFRTIVIHMEQEHALDRLQEYLREDLNNERKLDELFHEALMSFFCLIEYEMLMRDFTCPVQRFLMVLCLAV